MLPWVWRGWGAAAEAVQPAVVAALDDPNRYVSAKAAKNLGAHWYPRGDGDIVRLFVRRPLVLHYHQTHAVLIDHCQRSRGHVHGVGRVDLLSTSLSLSACKPPFRLGLIGCGGIVQQQHLPTLCELDTVCIAALGRPGCRQPSQRRRDDRRPTRPSTTPTTATCWTKPP